MIVTNGATLKWGWFYVAARAAYPVLVRPACSKMAAMWAWSYTAAMWAAQLRLGVTRRQCGQRQRLQECMFKPCRNRLALVLPVM